MRSSWLLATICLLFACGTPQAVQVSPVQKVIELLENLKGKVTADLDAEAKAMDEYMKYCDFEAKDTEFAIKTAQRDLEDLGAVVEDSSAGISNCEDEISTISSEFKGHQINYHKGSRASASKSDVNYKFWQPSS